MRALALTALSLTLFCGGALPAQSQDTLKLYFVDVEGGQATLIVTPQGQSLLIDAGWPGHDGRDAKRIIAAAQSAGVKQIDYLLVTHYHLDHVGGVADLASRFPVKTLVDHGTNVETDPGAKKLNEAYQQVLAKGTQRLTVKPGDKLPIEGITVTVVTAAGKHLERALPEGGRTNSACGEEQPRPNDPSENAQSVGVVIGYGKFRFVDMGDLTWNKELEISCPTHQIGPVDLYLTSHHGLDQSGSKALVYGLHPRVAIMNNGAKKGGSPAAWKIVSSSPQLEDLWQLHTALAGGTETNVNEQKIANVDEQCQGYGIVVTAKQNREFTVTNQRNQFSKTYKP